MWEAAVQARIARLVISTVLAIGLGFGTIQVVGPVRSADSSKTDFNGDIARHAKEMLEEGKQTFRFDTFGDTPRYHTGSIGPKPAAYPIRSPEPTEQLSPASLSATA